MSIAYRIYETLLPRSLRQHLAPLQVRFHQWKLARHKLWLSSPEALGARRRRLRQLFSKRPIRVAFQVAQLGKWKSESIYRLMEKDPRFSPCIWCVPVADYHRTKPELHKRESERIISYFTEKGVRIFAYNSLEEFPPEERPDLIFIYEAYDGCFAAESFRGMEKELFCYVPYCFHNSDHACAYDSLGNHGAVFEFVENESYFSYVRLHSSHRGRICVVTGTPLADVFMGEAARTAPVWKDCGKPMKKVIWAPHWTIVPGSSWFVCGTFLKNAEAMLELAQKYKDEIQFAFKPHPVLYKVLCELPGWGKEKTDAFYHQWQEMPNTQLEEGAYTALFMQSDAMIHDSGSFILEYLFADKPCMFLRENEGYGNYNEQSLDCLQACQFGLTKEDIEKFLQRSVLGPADPLREVRAEMRRRYLLPPHGKSAAQNIIDAIVQA